MTTPAATVPLFDPTGTLRDVAPADLREALAQGWEQASPEQVAAYERSEKFGTPGQQAVTFAEGVGKGVLGPVIPAVEQAFGVPAEDIRARIAMAAILKSSLVDRLRLGNEKEPRSEYD